MKKLFTVFFFIFFFSLSGSAQPLYLNWTKFIGGTSGDGGYVAISTSDGGILFGGLTSDTIGSGDIPASSPDSQSILANNLLLGKIDSNRQLSWIKVYGGHRTDRALQLMQLPDGGFAVLGETESHDGDIAFNHGSKDLWLLRLDSSGNLLWEKTYGSSSGDHALSFAQTSSSGYIILGSSNGSDNDVPFHYGTNQFLMDWFVVKTDSLGNLLWSKTIGGTGDEWSINGSIYEINNAYYLIGCSSSKDYDCTDTSWHPGVNTGMDVFVLKMDTTGNQIWNKSFGGSEQESHAISIFDQRDSAFAIVMGSQSNDYMLQNTYTAPANWLLKIDTNGNLLSAKVAGDSLLYTSPLDIICYEDSAYLLSTWTQADYWLSIIDSTGNFSYYKRIGGTNNELFSCNLVEYKQGIALVGTTVSSDLNEGGRINDHRGSSDVFVSGISEIYSPLITKKIRKASTEIILYPNPTKDILRVILPTNEGGIVYVTDQSGKVVYEHETNAIEIEIATAAWTRGNYIVNWKGKRGAHSTAKVLVN
ncbi:MAG TPA: T9SS type A sorting domain-containing protein [Flavipsychrobacter sp.]|nr:T9SS type A sorting domain-containing protein [Flavipsychrobacter sp.]